MVQELEERHTNVYEGFRGREIYLADEQTKGRRWGQKPIEASRNHLREEAVNLVDLIKTARELREQVNYLTRDLLRNDTAYHEAIRKQIADDLAALHWEDKGYAQDFGIL